jgi:hypothetical protein
MPDWTAAFVPDVLYNIVAYHPKSLSPRRACLRPHQPRTWRLDCGHEQWGFQQGAMALLLLS